MSPDVTVVAWGLLGGVAAEALRWYQLRESLTLPAYLRRPFYWVATAVMVLLGGVLVVLYQVPSGSPLIAVNVGASAPLIIKALAANTPAKEPPFAFSFRIHGMASPSTRGPEVEGVTRARRAATGSAPNVEPTLLSFLAGR